MNEALVPPFDVKIAVAVRDDLEPWQRLNVTAFLTSGVTAAMPTWVGEPYADADGQTYLALLGMPVLVFEASAGALVNVRERALRRDLPLAIYTSDMFRTGHDAANREVVASVAGSALDLVGVATYGPRSSVDKTMKGTHLHP